MKFKSLHFLLVLIALQSTIAVADLHQTHQSGQDHLNFDHQENSSLDASENQPNNPSKISTKISYDCHHCCHCHGFVQHFMDNQNDSFVSAIDSSSPFENFTLFYSHVISPDLRPPIV